MGLVTDEVCSILEERTPRWWWMAFGVTGALTLDYRPFGLDQPGYMGITVKAVVEVAVALHFAEEP